MDTSVSDRPRIADALDRVSRTLLERRTRTGHWEGRLSSSALATATAVTALSSAQRAGLAIPRADVHVQAGLEWLLATRNDDGGWGDTPDSISNISTTALVWAALSVGNSTALREADAAAAAWLARAAGGGEPRHLAAALAARYGKDRTFSVPILTMCAIAGRLGTGEAAWQLIPQLPFELAVFPRRLFGAMRLPVVSYALPALISMGLARHRRGRSLPLVSRARERAAPRVLRVLETLQPRNGGFLEAIPLTSFVAMSLIAAGEQHHPVVERGLGFLVQSVREDGSWPIDTNLATWATTLAVNALAQGSAWQALTTEDRRHLLEWLLRQQWNVDHPYTGAAPGGWAWTDLPGGVPDADDTAGALIALSHLAPEDDRVRHAAEAGIQWLLDLQNSDGGIPTFCRGWGTLPFDRSSTDLTAHALRAWSAWSERVEPKVRRNIDVATGRAIAFLARAQRADGAFVPLWFGNQRAADEENPVFGTSRVLKGLASVRGSSAAAAREIGRRAQHFVVAAQSPSGGWGGGIGADPSIEETAVALAGLSSGLAQERHVEEAVRRGEIWLAAATHQYAHFDAAPIGLYFARLWYAEELYPLLFAADALSRVTSRLAD